MIKSNLFIAEMQKKLGQEEEKALIKQADSIF
jgi:hypothetical protein